jgi:hypothetical protein
MFEVTIRDHVVFSFVLKLGDKLVDLILGQACFELFEASSDLLSAKLTTLRFTGLPLGEESLISQTFL